MPPSLRQITECFLAFTEATQAPSFLLDATGRILATNGAAHRLFGLQRDTITGTLLTGLSADSGDKVHRYLHSCARTSSPVPGVITLRTPDGERKTPCYGFHLNLPADGHHGLVVLQIVSSEKSIDKFLALNRTLEELRASRLELLHKSERLEQEINERIRAEEQLRLSHNRLAAILDSIEAIVYVADMHTYELLFINRYCRELLGEITGSICWQTIQVGQTGPCAFCTNSFLVDAAGNPGAPYIWEFQNTRTGRWFHITDRAIRWVDGRIVRLEIALDITAKKEAEEKISAAKKEWERTFDAIDEAITIHDGNLTILRANRAAGQLFGLPPEKLIGRKCHDLFRGAATLCPGCPEPAVKAGRTAASAEICQPKLGRTFAVSYSPIIDEEGRAERFVHIAKDITEQAQLQSKLRQAQKMEAVGTLAGGIAHDFNNVLSPIIGFTELALAQLGADHPVAPDLAQVLQAAKRARDLVQQILAFSRQSAGERKPLQIHLIVKEAIKLLRSSLPSSIDIRQQIDPESGIILADPTQIHQILMNLCTNAYHAMRPQGGGVLTIALSRLQLGGPEGKTAVPGLPPGPYVELMVKDTGCGMERMIIDKIFDPYFTTKPQNEGTGLGLAVVHGIVVSCGGHISVDSEPGKGTAFHILLPATEKQTVPAEIILQTVLPRGRGERIVVVDDEEIIITLQKKLLEELGYRVKAFVVAEEAQRLIAAEPDGTDLLVTDMTMPRLSGLDLARQVHAVRPDLPVILCTGFSELITEETANQAGIFRLLMKPVPTREFARTIREALDAGQTPL